MARLWCVVAWVLVVGVVGCNKSDSKEAKGGGDGGGSAAGTPVAGMISGRALTEEGKPITANGATVTVNVGGVGSKSGERLDYNTAVKPDGTYSQKLVDGAFHAEATVEVTWNGKVYHVRLHPVQNNRVDRESAGGIQQDFTWKMTGARPNGNGTYGPNLGMVYESWRQDLKKAVPPPPAGAKAVFTLTPKGPRIDGGEAKAITFERTFDRLVDAQKDIPVAVYTVTAVEVLPDGSKRPLVVRNPGLMTYAESCEVTFAPGSVLLNGYENATVNVSRKME